MTAEPILSTPTKLVQMLDLVLRREPFFYYLIVCATGHPETVRAAVVQRSSVHSTYSKSIVRRMYRVLSTVATPQLAVPLFFPHHPHPVARLATTINA